MNIDSIIYDLNKILDQLEQSRLLAERDKQKATMLELSAISRLKNFIIRFDNAERYTTL